MQKFRFSILISTKNRCADLLRTLKSLEKLMARPNVECVVFDDGSTDGTSQTVQTNFPGVVFKRNETSKGYLYCRNQMLNETTSDYAISLDDDANFLSVDPLETISTYFEDHPECGLIAFRIFWGLDLPSSELTSDTPHRVRGFVGCGHVWRMVSWNVISNYPEWFGFYGEEEFSAHQLFLKNIEVHYLPSICIHHRVDMKGRKTDKSYKVRMRRSLASGWYLFYLFLPIDIVVKKMISSIFGKVKQAVKEKKVAPLIILLQATRDLISKTPYLFRERQAFTKSQHVEFYKIPPTKIYWIPNKSS